MAFAAGVIPPASAFTSVDDRFAFALFNTYTFKDGTMHSTETLSEATCKSLAEIRHYLTDLVVFLEKSSLISPILANMYGLIKALMDVELYRRGSRRYASYKAAIEELAFVWRNAEDVQRVLKVLPAFAAEFPLTKDDPLSVKEKDFLLVLYDEAIRAICTGNSYMASRAIAVVAGEAEMMNRSVPEITLLVYKMRLLAVFVLNCEAGWLAKYYVHKPEELMREAKEILGALHVM